MRTTRSRKSEERNRSPRNTTARPEQRTSTIADAGPEDVDEAQLRAQDGDSVPQPLEDWADDDDTNRWLDQHRLGEDDRFSIN